MDSCPDDVKKRGEVLSWNGISGFQAPDGGGKDCFVVCFIDINESSFADDLAAIKEETQCRSLTDDDWTGRDYLRVHWRDHSRIPLVLNALLKRGYDFQTATRGLPFFDSKKDTFNLATLEKKGINNMNELLEMGLVDLINDAFCEEWNYTTEEGKAFARKLKADPRMYRYDTTRTNFYEWPIFKDYDPLTLESIKK